MNISKIKKSRFGRLVCRILGEESGQAMMEYVIIAVLIAAACAVGVWYFGRSVNNEMRVASHGVTGDESAAKTAQQSSQSKVKGQDDAAKKHQKDMIKADDEGKADI